MGGEDYNVPLVKDESPLSVRLAIEASAAIACALSVAPIISIVDKAIVSNASGLEPLVPCLINGMKTLVFNPIYFLRQPSFLFIWGVYSGTYIVANSVEAICERNHKSSFLPKFLSSSVANVSLSVLKDSAFAKMFGKGDPRPMPIKSMGLFAARDSMTILASFSLPGVIAGQLHRDFGYNRKSAETCAQLFTPVTMQLLSTPLHLHGLDLYNRDVATKSERLSFIAKECIQTTLARMARIFPAYGIGGVVNKQIRNIGRLYLSKLYKL
jgi:hypothetical protein